MVGDRHVLVAQRLGGPQHRLDRVAPVAPVGVHVQIAADLVRANEVRQRPGGRPFHFARALPQLRRDRHEIERLVERIFGWQRHRATARADERVRGERQAHRAGARPQLAQVRRRPCEMHEAGYECLWGHDADRELGASDSENDPVAARVQHGGDGRQGEQAGARAGRIGRRGQHVEVTHRGGKAAEAARGREMCHLGAGPADGLDDGVHGIHARPSATLESARVRPLDRRPRGRDEIVAEHRGPLRVAQRPEQLADGRGTRRAMQPGDVLDPKATRRREAAQILRNVGQRFADGSLGPDVAKVPERFANEAGVGAGGVTRIGREALGHARQLGSVGMTSPQDGNPREGEQGGCQREHRRGGTGLVEPRVVQVGACAIVRVRLAECQGRARGGSRRSSQPPGAADAMWGTR